MSCCLVKLQDGSGNPFRQAIDYILSTQKINGGKGVVVKYRACYHISLMPGFHAERYSRFSAYISDSIPLYGVLGEDGTESGTIRHTTSRDKKDNVSNIHN